MPHGVDEQRRQTRPQPEDAEPVFAPHVPEVERRVLSQKPAALLRRRGDDLSPPRRLESRTSLYNTDGWDWAAEDNRRRLAGAAAVAGGFLAFVGGLIWFAVGTFGGSADAHPMRRLVVEWVSGAVCVAGGVLIAGAVVHPSVVLVGPAELRAKRLGHALRGSYITPSLDLDESACSVLRRARTAASRVLMARVYTDGQLDAAAEVVLPDLLWDLAVDLADLTELRAKTARSGKNAGPATLEALAPRRTAAKKAARALETRVATLERYAQQVTDLNEKYLDHIAARAVAIEEDDVLDAVSGRARDGLALAEIGGLADELPLLTERIELDCSTLVEAAGQLAAAIAAGDQRAGSSTPEPQGKAVPLS